MIKELRIEPLLRQIEKRLRRAEKSLNVMKRVLTYSDYNRLRGKIYQTVRSLNGKLDGVRKIDEKKVGDTVIITMRYYIVFPGGVDEDYAEKKIKFYLGSDFDEFKMEVVAASENEVYLYAKIPMSEEEASKLVPTIGYV